MIFPSLREIFFSVNYSNVKRPWDILIRQIWKENIALHFSLSATLFHYCLCYSFDEANYFSSINIKRTFSFSVGWNSWNRISGVCACISRKLFHTHTYCERKKERKRLVLIYSSLEDDVNVHECGTPKAKCKQLTFSPSFRHSKGNIIVLLVDLSSSNETSISIVNKKKTNNEIPYLEEWWSSSALDHSSMLRIESNASIIDTFLHT